MKLVFVWNIQISFQLLNTGMKYHHDVRSTQSRYVSIFRYYKQINIETFKTIFSNDRTYWSYLHWKIKKPNESTTTTCYPCDPLTTNSPMLTGGSNNSCRQQNWPGRRGERDLRGGREGLAGAGFQTKQVRTDQRDKRKQNTCFYKLVFTLFVFYSSPRLGGCKSLH